MRYRVDLTHVRKPTPVQVAKDLGRLRRVRYSKLLLVLDHHRWDDQLAKLAGMAV